MDVNVYIYYIYTRIVLDPSRDSNRNLLFCAAFISCALHGH